MEDGPAESNWQDNCQNIKMKALGKVHEISVSKGIVHTVHFDNLRFNKGAHMS